LLSSQAAEIAWHECWNAAAVSSVLPVYLTRTQWVLAGVSKKEMIVRTKAAWAAHELGLPAPRPVHQRFDARGGGPLVSHVMFFVPATEDSKWGANVTGAPIFATTSDAGPITTFFVVAPKWSDGTLGPYVQTVPNATTAKIEFHHH